MQEIAFFLALFAYAGRSTPRSQDSADELSQERPSFLNRFDDDPDRAFGAFYHFTMALARRLPPAPLRAVPEDARLDLIHDVVYRCVKDDFRLLRRWQPRGRAFSAWVYSVLHNSSVDWLRKNNLRRRVLVPWSPEGDDIAPEDVVPDPRGDLAGEAIAKVTLERLEPLLRATIENFTFEQNILLSLRLQGLKPREIAALLGRGLTNKQVSEAISTLGRRMKADIERAGRDSRDLLDEDPHLVVAELDAIMRRWAEEGQGGAAGPEAVSAPEGEEPC